MSVHDEAAWQSEQDAIRDIANEAAEKILAGVQTFESRPEEVAAAIRRMHRRHQQRIAQVVFNLIRGWSDDFAKGNFDARNDATCAYASIITEGIKPVAAELPERLPYI